MSSAVEDLLERFRAGEGGAAALCHACLPAARCMALSATRAPDRATIVLERAFPRFLERIACADDPSSLLGLLEESVQEEARGLEAAQGRLPSGTEELPPDVGRRAGRGPVDLAALLGDQPHALGARLLLEALSRLPPRYRLPLLLRHVEGLGYDEIASVLGVPRTAMGSALAGGRQLFERELGYLLRGSESR